jgi:hypothetical protein
MLSAGRTTVAVDKCMILFLVVRSLNMHFPETEGFCLKWKKIATDFTVVDRWRFWIIHMWGCKGKPGIFLSPFSA